MNKSICVVAALTIALAACGERAPSVADLSDQPHTVEQYYADDALRSGTIEACKARNEAESKIMQAKPACANAMTAMKRHSAESMEKAIVDDNARLEAAFKKARDERKQSN